MPTQSNRQTQNVKVVVNNKGCCEPKRRKPRRRPKQSAELPPEEVQMPPVPPMKDFSRGLSAYPVRPSLYAPVSTTIQMDGGLRQVPSYFEKQLTNQQLTLEQLQRTIEDQYDDLLNQMGQMQPAPIPTQAPIAPQSTPQFQPATINSLITPPSSVASASTVPLPSFPSSPSSSYTTGVGFPHIPEANEVPRIIRGIIDPSTVPMPMQQQPQIEQSEDDLPEILQMRNVEAAYGSNHPYTRALRLYRNGERATGSRRTAINAQIRQVAAEYNISGHTIAGILGSLTQVPRQQ